MGALFSDFLEAWTVANISYEDYLDNHLELGTADQLFIEYESVKALAEGYMERVAQHPREIQLGTRDYDGIPFNGFLDGLVDNATIVENKLKSQWSTDNQEALLLDDQVTCYVTHWALETEQNPEDIELRYHVTRRPALRQRKEETIHEFVDRIRIDIRDRPDHYYIHVPDAYTFRSQEQVQDYLDDTKSIAVSINRSNDEQSWPKNTGACNQYNSLCEFFKICTASPNEIANITEQHYKERTSERNTNTGQDQEG